MSDVFFTSDLHLGHKLTARERGFSSVEDHDKTIIENINNIVGKRAKLFILGDVCLTKQSFELLKEMQGVKELICGNHDNYSTPRYAEHFVKIHGFRRYKNFWLSHCPVHPQEMYRVKGNIHGHIHKNTDSPELPLPYFNVNVEFHNMKPVSLEMILDAFNEK